MNLFLPALSLHGPGGKALDDFSVAQQKQDDGRNKCRNNPRRAKPVGLGIREVQHADADLDRPVFGTVCYQKRPQIHIP